jgi:hypothetical protein
MKKKVKRCSATPNTVSAECDKQRTMPKRRSSWSLGRIALILAVVGFALIVVLVIPREQKKPAEPLSQEAVTFGNPINTVDPTSGNPIVAGITSTYKGYTVGHCCEASKGEWEALSESRKDSAIQQFLR